MTEALLKGAGIAVAGAFSAMVLKERNKGMGVAISLCAFLTVCIISLGGGLSSVMESLRAITEKSPVSEYTSVMLKALFIGYITCITADICKSAGEDALSRAAVLSGKLQLILLAMPLITTLMDIALALS